MADDDAWDEIRDQVKDIARALDGLRDEPLHEVIGSVEMIEADLADLDNLMQKYEDSWSHKR